MSDSEPDFDDPRFLIDVPTTVPQEISYTEKRKRKLIESEIKGRNKSRKQLEEEQREIGLSENLLNKASRGGGENKALRMMQAMGFKPGDSLGKQDQPTPKFSSGGFAKASFSPSIGTSSASSSSTPTVESEMKEDIRPKGTNEPIKFQIRTGRTGLGIPQKVPTAPQFTSSSSSTASSSQTPQFQIDSTPLPSLSTFLSHIRSTITSKKAYGILKSCRRTLEELDRRNGVEENVMWFDPDELEREENVYKNKALFEKLDKEVESASDNEEEDRSEKRKEKSELDYLRGKNQEVVELDEEREEREREMNEEEEKKERERRDKKMEEGLRKEEREEWFKMDVETRLALTLAYLRHHYHYCFYCGCQYNDQKDLEENCPGTEEEDH
ncbi:hypothetical protein JCM16303_003876 [Sporobolomyces ruberrimus]